jgi:hypothetical protein
MVCFRSWISLLIFCLDGLSFGDRGVLKSPTTTVLEFIYVCRSFGVCLMKLGALMLGAYRLIIVIYFLLVYFPFYQYGMSFFVSFDPCEFEVYFVQDKYCYSCLFLGTSGLVNLPAIHP